MTADLFAVRSLLFLPASNARAVAKARTLDADMVVLDLEDAVRPEDKVSARDSAVEAAKRFIDENLCGPLDIETIAREVALSPSHFKRVFREVEGVSPWAYVTERRVRRAEELLREERPLSEIAIETGFADQSHFTRVFKRLTGRTPGAAREDDPIDEDKEDRAA